VLDEIDGWTGVCHSPKKITRKKLSIADELWKNLILK
jgi:hypothetical protein